MSSGRSDVLEISRGNGVRLRRAELDEYEQVALPWYQDPEVLELSEGGEAPYDRAKIRRMFEVLSSKGELYLIEVQEAGGWRAVGDAALIPEDTPIVIGRPDDRSHGIGTEVLQLLLLRARALGWTEVHVDGIVPANHRSRRLFERAGFVVVPAASGAPDAPIAMIKRMCTPDEARPGLAGRFLDFTVRNDAAVFATRDGVTVLLDDLPRDPRGLAARLH